jgi:hypothetical protein
LPVIFIEQEEQEERMSQENVSLYLIEEKSNPFIRSKIISSRSYRHITKTHPLPAMGISQRDLTSPKTNPVDLITRDLRVVVTVTKFTNYS